MEQIAWVTKYWLEVAFGVICTVFAAAWKHLYNKIKKRSLEDIAMREATLALQDDSMGRLYQACKDKGYATREEARRYERMYRAYDGLGGNGAVSIEHKQFALIEIKDE